MLSCYLEAFFRSRLAHLPRRDVIMVSCRRRPATEAVHVVGSIAAQLLSCDESRLAHACENSPPEEWLPTHPPLAFGQDYLDWLWRLIRGSLDASSPCEVDFILDGVDAVQPEEPRDAFLENIVTMINNLKGGNTIKVFISSSSLPSERIPGMLTVEKDKERQG